MYKRQVHKSEMINARTQKNLLIIGAGRATKDVIRIIKTDMQKNYNIVGIIDDNPEKIKYAISGVRIVGDRYKIREICRNYKVEVIFFCISSIDNRNKMCIRDSINCNIGKISFCYFFYYGRRYPN